MYELDLKQLRSTDAVGVVGTIVVVVFVGLMMRKQELYVRMLW